MTRVPRPPSPLRFTVIFLVPAVAAASIAVGGLALAAAPVFVFGLIPLFDRIVPADRRNAPETELRRAAAGAAYRLLLYAFLPAQTALLVFGAVAVSRSTEAGTLLGVALAVGISGGAVGITVAHELIHRASAGERAVGIALLALVGYAHFRIEHVRGHHVHVATPVDPATAAKGVSVYRFWFRSVFGGLASAARIEARRLRRKGRSVLSLSNRFILYALSTLGGAAAFGLALSPIATLFFVLQALVAFSLLEVVNYIEHYGLERRIRGDGSYERVGPAHSWNSPALLTNAFLINLQRHTDHHMDAGRRYQALRHIEEAPQLPAGYAAMVMLALVPPLWRRVIDPRIPPADSA